MHFSGKALGLSSNRKDITEFTAKHFNEERIETRFKVARWKNGTGKDYSETVYI